MSSSSKNGCQLQINKFSSSSWNRNKFTRKQQLSYHIDLSLRWKCVHFMLDQMRRRRTNSSSTSSSKHHEDEEEERKKFIIGLEKAVFIESTRYPPNRSAFDYYRRTISKMVHLLKENGMWIMKSYDPDHILLMNEQQLLENTKLLSKLERSQEHMRECLNVLKTAGDLFQQQPQQPSSQKKSLTCRDCGKSNISMEGAQTRGADEGQTAYFTCKDCGKRWRM